MIHTGTNGRQRDHWDRGSRGAKLGAPRRSRRQQEAPGSPRMPQEAQGRLRRRQEAPGGPIRPRETPGSSRTPQEPTGGPRKSQEVPRSPRKRRAALGGAKKPQEAPGSTGQPQAAPEQPTPEHSGGVGLACLFTHWHRGSGDSDPGPQRDQLAPGVWGFGSGDSN